jgi:hypothetical protein
VAYTKLDENLVSSSVWSEDDRTLRVWVYLMAKADSQGWVLETIPAIARACGYDVATTEAILERLAGPDKYSRTPDMEGRRIAILREPEFGIFLVNHAKYRGKDHTNAERQRRYRNAHRNGHRNGGVTADNGESRRVTQAEAEAEAEAETENRKSASADADAVLAYWSERSCTNLRSGKVRDKTLSRIKARLKDGFTVGDLKACVDYALEDEFYRSKGFHKNPAVLWKDAERVEKLSGSPAGGPEPAPVVQGSDIPDGPEEVARLAAERDREMDELLKRRKA